jgi:hypothetical protein
LFGTETENKGSGFKMKQILKTTPQTDTTQYTYKYYNMAFFNIIHTMHFVINQLSPYHCALVAVNWYMAFIHYAASLQMPEP